MIRPELWEMKISRPATLDECIGDFASTELTLDCFRAADHPYLGFGEESRSFIRRIVVVCELACFP